MLGDLKNARAMYLKAMLFVALGVLAVCIIALLSQSLSVVALAMIAVWAFARAYYFVFYVIEKYIDSSYRFDGLVSAFRHLAAKRRNRSRCKLPQ